MKEIKTVVLRVFYPTLFTTSLFSIVKIELSLNIDFFKQEAIDWSLNKLSRYLHSYSSHAYLCQSKEIIDGPHYYVDGKLLTKQSWERAVSEHEFDVDLHRIIGTVE